MKNYILLLISISFSIITNSQTNFNGNWEGVMIRAGRVIENGIPFKLEIQSKDNKISGYSREEILNTNEYALKQVTGYLKENKIKIHQTVIEKKSKSSKTKWCRLTAELIYNKNTGYLEGKFESIDCKRFIGKIILYKCQNKLIKKHTEQINHNWFNEFVYGIKENLNAPEIRIKERKNFIFKPVFFDFDKYIIRPEFHNFLDEITKIVKGHSDLRIKVVGHTDSDGTEEYNIILSKKRSESIIEYFSTKGIARDRIEFDFKGEKMPIDTNSTNEGRQRNRRVDFFFI